MRLIAGPIFRVASAATFLGILLPVVLAHGHDEAMDMGEGDAMGADQLNAEPEYKPTYFAHPEHRALLLAHIATMVVAWVVELPLGMLATKLKGSCFTDGLFAC